MIKFDVAPSNTGKTTSSITVLISATLTSLTNFKICSFQSSGRPWKTCLVKFPCAALAILACPLAIPSTILLIAPSKAKTSKSFFSFTKSSTTFLLALKAAKTFGER
jgi:hypothetical protein